MANETITGELHSVEDHNQELVNEVREKSCQESLRRTVHNTTRFFEMQSEVTIPSMINGVTMLHDSTVYLNNDMTTYKMKLFYNILKRLDTEEQVRIESESTLTFTEGDRFSFSNLPDQMYNDIQSEIQASPVFAELNRISHLLGSYEGESLSIPVSSLTEEERQILLRILGLTDAAIHDFNELNEKLPLRHSPGLSVSSPDQQLIIHYEPEPVAQEALAEISLWSKTGEEIIKGLGTYHFSSTFEHILSEGYIPTEGSYEFSSRYGNGYADVTRLLSMCIGKDTESVADLIWNDPDHRLTQGDKHHWQKLAADSNSAPVREFFRLLNDVCFTQYDQTEDSAETTESQYPHFKKSKIISYRDGSCKDAENYYCEASTEKLVQSSQYFLEKQNSGSGTALVLSPIVVGGVVLQPGHLVKLEKDKEQKIIGIQPLRFTMFMFSNEEARDAFGWQHTETLENTSRKHITPINNLRRHTPQQEVLETT